ncbi:methyl-accepting chemotaxis protein [Rahnella sp. SAP-1]|jgi:methyl-accepting chemotaxis protein|uniref:Methyl-accepting chemotaxis protein n=1 Tax=Rouxiella aceris TaxID=2703884 RepID=A0A848MI67_9GAMM|nr:methyl-accepting chemotaxis protein [Rouxiella aceris]NMP26682.1 methyl-accepting chemotaxis protein [Rouxiella aceris]
MNYIRDIKIRTALILILSIFSLLWAGAAGFALYSLKELKLELGVTNIQQQNGDIINGANAQYYRVITALERAMVGLGKNDTVFFDAEIKATHAELDNLKNGLSQFKAIDHGNLDSTTIDDIYNSSFNLYNNAVLPLAEAANQQKISDFEKIKNDKYLPLRRDFSSAIDKYNAKIESLNSDANQRITQWVAWCQYILIGALSLGVVIMLATDRYLVTYLVRPVNTVKAHLESLALGILDHKIIDLGRNCIGLLTPSIDKMQDNWAKTVREIRNSADSIYKGSSEISTGNADLSSRTEEQASALDETASSMEQLGSTVKQNADNAHQASTLADQATKEAHQGGVIVNEVVTTMTKINSSSHKIVDIISVINSIAFQTNILALNAAVEAARAGEQGRGFAVVASEVRNLAQRSAQAAKEIGVLINESVENIQSGSEQVTRAGDAMEKIVSSVSHVNDIMSEIASASSEQSKGISQIGTAVVQMDSVTQQNAALVQQSATAAASLEEQARLLTEIVSIFKIEGEEHNSAANVLLRPKQLTKVNKKALVADTGTWTKF